MPCGGGAQRGPRRLSQGEGIHSCREDVDMISRGDKAWLLHETAGGPHDCMWVPWVVEQDQVEELGPVS